jgi:hypothetical protein
MPPTGLLPQSGAPNAVLFGGAATPSASAFRLLCAAAGAAAEELVRRVRGTVPGAAVDEAVGPWPLPSAPDAPVVHLASVTAGGGS